MIPLKPNVNNMHSANRNSHLGLAFWSLAAICLWNLNGVTALAFGQSQILSGIMLMLCLSIFGYNCNSLGGALGKSGRWFSACSVTYLAIAACTKFDRQYVISHGNSILIVIASAQATFVLVRQISLERFLGVLTFLAVMGAWTVFLSPYLGWMYASAKNSEAGSNVGRWMGFFANPNDTGIAGVYALSCCLTISCFTINRTRAHRFLPAIVFVLATGVVLTFSRSSMLSFAVVGIVFLLISVQRNRRTGLWMFCGAFFYLVAVVFFTEGYRQFQWSSDSGEN